jgi:hypothetical protein
VPNEEEEEECSDSRRQFKRIIMSGDENQLAAMKMSEPSFTGKNIGHYSYSDFG